jgi:hypothetical protein
MVVVLVIKSVPVIAVVPREMLVFAALIRVSIKYVLVIVDVQRMGNVFVVPNVAISK